MQFSDDELLDALGRLTELLGHTPRERDATAHPDFPSHKTYVNRFGSWRKALDPDGDHGLVPARLTLRVGSHNGRHTSLIALVACVPQREPNIRHTESPTSTTYEPPEM